MISVRTATADDTDAVLDTLMLAFAADPMFRYFWRKPTDYFRNARILSHGRGKPGFEAGTVTIAGDFEAAAVWLPPGAEPDPTVWGEVQFGAVDEAGMEELSARIQACHPTEPHWYLWMIGVDPPRQGRGLGSALLAHQLAQCDEAGELAYLESSDPKNVPLYERHGFEVLDVIQAGDLPVLTPMIRRRRR